MLGPIKGSFVIDVAAGTGGLAVAADRGAQVLATDLNPAMIERTQERLRPFRLCQAEIMDFQSLTVADATADIAVSNFGMLAYPTWRRLRQITLKHYAK
jgi:ubiquinone/menaquinone biosynthesis C-methylase UbiE